jgi:DNA modification methylase
MQVVFISAALNLKRKFIEIEIEIDPQRFEVANKIPKLLHKKSFQQDYREYMHKKSILPIER